MPWDEEDFGWIISHGIAKLSAKICMASPKDLGELSLVLAASPPEIVSIVRTLCDLSQREVDWTELWASLQPI
ncbi:hypothetical protein L284_06405 [Novosphingobium lindaniclasticum LE124]|uniref:Uncharacterized protein n=1 Tax=Novosphingobium lindaniclasticum LE124 TaxID=1096930 RepID=T0HXN4_9SPHN|nr:hypothetical protein L284_06405 [Novosphingobium lindaniclasticum LE124]